MTWFVIKFDAENTVEAVPNSWYVKKKSQCYWPPEGTTKNTIHKFIKKKHFPQANWILYEASYLGAYDKYKTAEQKANKARVTNNLSSNNDEFREKTTARKKKTNKKNYNKSGSEYELSSEISSSLSSSDDILYPEPPTEQTESSNRMIEYNTDENETRANTNHITSNPTSSTNIITSALSDTAASTSSRIELLNPKLNSNFTSNISEKAFEQRVLRELHILNLKLDDISETMNTLLKDKSNEKLLQKSFACNNVPEIIQSFPVNEDSLAQLENWLISSAENKTILAKNLSRIGGCNVKEVVRRIMYHVFTNEVGMSYSWEGAKKKKIFKNLAVASSILSAVRFNTKTEDATDSEIIFYIKAWLVRSKDRFNNNNKNKNVTPQREKQREEREEQREETEEQREEREEQREEREEQREGRTEN